MGNHSSRFQQGNHPKLGRQRNPGQSYSVDRWEAKMAAYSRGFSCCAFVAGTWSFAALHSAANLLPLRPLVAALQIDSRLSQTVVTDRGFASVRGVGNGLYATISVTTKGLQTMCNGGFLAGKDSALLMQCSRMASGHPRYVLL